VPAAAAHHWAGAAASGADWRLELLPALLPLLQQVNLMMRPQLVATASAAAACDHCSAVPASPGARLATLTQLHSFPSPADRVCCGKDEATTCVNMRPALCVRSSSPALMRTYCKLPQPSGAVTDKGGRSCLLPLPALLHRTSLRPGGTVHVCRQAVCWHAAAAGGRAQSCDADASS
jgi:hypothetical protein